MSADLHPAPPDDDRGAGGAWPPLRLSGRPSAFPVDALPAPAARWVAATATATQTPPDLAATCALAVLAAAAMRDVRVEVRPGWTEEVGLYAALGLPSGERKSIAVGAAVGPLRDVERERRDRERADVQRRRAERDALEQRRQTLAKQAARTDDPGERERITREAGEIAARLDAERVPVMPRLLADDATPEALAGLLAAHDRVAVIAAESAFLDNLAGRYADGRSNLHLVCGAYSGEATSVDRRGRDPETLERPVLTLALVVQPHRLDGLAGDGPARQQGLVGRCLLVRPQTRLGEREINPEPVPAAVAAGWDDLVRRVAEPADRTDRTAAIHPPEGVVSVVSALPEPRTLYLGPGALGALDELRAAQEPRLADGGDLRPVADWINRHAGRIARIAALLHLADGTPSDTVDVPTMRRALTIGAWSLEHALDVLTGPDHLDRAAVAWLRRRPHVTVRELHRGPFGGRGPAEAAQDLAERLVDLGVLRPVPAPGPGPHGGRPPSPRYDVHPDLRGAPPNGGANVGKSPTAPAAALSSVPSTIHAHETSRAGTARAPARPGSDAPADTAEPARPGPEPPPADDDPDGRDAWLASLEHGDDPADLDVHRSNRTPRPAHRPRPQQAA